MSRSLKQANAVVIGGAGFLGSHLVEHLIEDRECRVLVVDNLCVGRRDFVHPRAEFHHADITHSEEHLRRAFARFHEGDPRSADPAPLFVFNYAAWPYIPDSFERPLHVFETNATGAIKVINAAQDAGAAGILQVSSAELYGEGGGPEQFNEHQRADKIDEEAPVVPHSTYGAAKAAVDYYCQSAWKERRTPVLALRQFNCVGERETHPYIVPEIIGQLDKQGPRNHVSGGRSTMMATRATVKLGNNSFRDFLYAGDAVRAATRLVELGSWGEVYNLGSQGGTKIYDLARRIGNLMGFSDVSVERDEARVRPWEIWHLQSDNSKIEAAIGSVQPTTLDTALTMAIRWYEKNGRRWPWEVAG